MIVGIDPGGYGAIAAPDIQVVYDMPSKSVFITKNTKGKLQLRDKLNDIITEINNKLNISKIVVEAQRSFGKEGRNSMMTIGRNYDMFFSLAYYRGIEIDVIQPRDWKDYYKLTGKPKEASVDLCEELWPDMNFRGPKGAKKDGRADAMLIGQYYKEVKCTK